jgi:two-component system NtrC family sensor kinase
MSHQPAPHPETIPPPGAIRRFPWTRRLAFKLILSLTLIVAVVAGISQVINIRTQEQELVKEVILAADQLSRSITSATWEAMSLDKRGAAYKIMKTIALKQGIDRIRIFNKDGGLMFSTAPAEESRLDKSAEVCTPCHLYERPLVKPEVKSRARVFRGVDGRLKLGMITPIYNEPSCSEAACHAHPVGVSVLGVLDLDMDLDRVDVEMAAIRWRTLLMVALEITLIGIFIAFFTRHFVVKPIDTLIAGTQAVSAMKLDQPIEIRSSEELRELASSFNLMRERLQSAVAKNTELMQHLESKVDERTSQLHNAYEKLKQSDRLASLGQLSASVAHEINNPISGVLNLSMLMRRILTEDGIPPDRLPEFREYLQRVIEETTRVGRIVSDLLSFSRRSKTLRSLADLNEIVKRTVGLATHKLELANISTRLELAEPLPSVFCDASQIQQVVLNLLLNAAEATRGDGQVTIRTRLVYQGNQVILEVQDNGTGIPAEIQKQIFDPFFTTKEEGKGVGLGLAVVYGIVEAHGGEIDIDSRLGQGTTFQVILPLATPVEAVPSPKGNGHV